MTTFFVIFSDDSWKRFRSLERAIAFQQRQAAPCWVSDSTGTQIFPQPAADTGTDEGFWADADHGTDPAGWASPIVPSVPVVGSPAWDAAHAGYWASVTAEHQARMEAFLAAGLAAALTQRDAAYAAWDRAYSAGDWSSDRLYQVYEAAQAQVDALTATA